MGVYAYSEVMRFLTSLLATMVAVAVAAWMFEGISFEGASSPFTEEFTDKVIPVAVVSLIIWGVSLLVKPIVTLLSLPFIILTLGLFLLVVNALMLKLSAWIATELGLGFTVAGFWTALGGALVITIVEQGVTLALADD